MKAVKIVSLLLSLILTLSLFAACGAKDNGKESEQETTQAEKDTNGTDTPAKETETEAIKQKSSTLIGMLLGWAILIALGIISYFLLDAGADTLIYGAVMLVILLLSAWGAHRLLLKTAEKKYCQG